mmetsp:Transcript_39792/g.95515  ORF Transcript_39792/g.95515 Transcript_39792/m.95515 type:complete len:85 (+) Transcript_39792:343-597(+)
MVSMSRWLVGSSSSTKWGLTEVTNAKATRLFCPPDRQRIGWVCSCPPSPKRANAVLASVSFIPGNAFIRHSVPLRCICRSSTWC